MQDQLRQKYLSSLEQTAVIIKALWEKFLHGDKQTLADIRLHAHSLKGSGGTFGFPEISEAGRQLEEATDTQLREKINALLNIIGRVTSHQVADSDKNGMKVVRQDSQVSRVALVVVRNPDNAEVIANCIRRLDGIDSCVIASTGADADKHYRKNRFALIVLDLVLPDRDGREILREIKQSSDFNVPVLVISGVPNDSIYLECMASGADQYLSKPFDTDKLYFEALQILQPNQLHVVATRPQADQNQKSVLPQLKGESILVAEDDEMQAIFMSQKLTAQGAQVSVVENGRLAIEALHNNSYSALILDGMMPEMDGFETLKAIRSTSAVKGMPVIMVTAMGSEEDIVRGYECGANDYLLKPFSEEQLVARIKSLLVIAA